MNDSIVEKTCVTEKSQNRHIEGVRLLLLSPQGLAQRPKPEEAP